MQSNINEFDDQRPEFLAQLLPASSKHLQAKVFYEAGYAAGLAAVSGSYRRPIGARFGLVAACVCLAFGSGLIASRIAPSRPRPAASELAAQSAVANDSKVVERAPATVALDSESSVSSSGSIAASSFLIDSLTAWTRKSGMRRYGFLIGDSSVKWESLVVSEQPLVSESSVAASTTDWHDLIDKDARPSNPLQRLIGRLL